MTKVNKSPYLCHDHFDRYFSVARERYEMLLRRSRGEQILTHDTVLANWRFCNVFREDDKTTVWFRENIRLPLSNQPSVMLATVAFRAFNRIETGEVLAPFLLEDNWDLPEMERRLAAYQKLGNPLCTGAYIIKTRDGMPKLQSIMMSFRWAKMHEPTLLKWLREYPAEERRIEDFWKLLREFDYLGDFTANEVAIDLTHTYVLNNAPDVNTWTNPGPGCAQGLGLLLHDDAEFFNRAAKNDREIMINFLKVFLEASRDSQYWPSNWPKWTLHTCQFWSCEMQKYIKGQRGQRLKRRYRCAIT